MSLAKVADNLIGGILTHRKGVVAAFIVAALVSAVLFPLVGTNYDLTDYLPEDANSTQAVLIMEEEFSTSSDSTSVLVRDVSLADALVVKQEIEAIEGVSSVLWLDDVADLTVPLETMDESLVETYYAEEDALFSVTVDAGYEVEVVDALYELVDALGSDNAISGDAVDTAQTTTSVGSESTLAFVIVIPIIIALLIISTLSWVEPVLFLAAVGISIIINMGTNIVFGEVSFVTFSVSPILQLAVSLDYAIFLLHAFKKQRALHDSAEQAMAAAMKSSLSVIAASAVTTMFGFAALMFMQFQIGSDLGINLVKGVAFTFLTIMIFLPALTLCLYKLVDKTQHRPFMPAFTTVGPALAKARIPAFMLMVILIVPAFLGQANTLFSYNSNEVDPGMRSGADTIAVEEEFGRQNKVIVLVPRGDVALEAALGDALASYDEVTSVVSYASTVGSSIPVELLDEDTLSQFYSENYARIILYTDSESEGEETFAMIEAMQQTVAEYYDTYYFTGESPGLYDMRNVVEFDNVVVALAAVSAIFLVLLIMFKSLMLPVVLLLTIEFGIWTNLALSYFAGDSVNFVGYLIINTVQLGATIDYAILLTKHYLPHRKTMPAKEAISKALGETFSSLLVSATILITAGLALTFASSMDLVVTLGFLLARGAFISLVLVTCLLPALFVYLDRPIRATTRNSGFFVSARNEDQS